MIPTAWRAYRPPPVDTALAVAFVVLGQVVTWGRLDEPAAFTGSRSANAVLNLLLMTTLAWRRRAPLSALGAAVCIYFLSHTVVAHDMVLLGGFLPLIVLTASAGYHCPRGQALLAGALAWSAMLAVVLVSPWLGSVDAILFNSAVLLAPWAGARGLRIREDRAGALHAELARERAEKEVAMREVVASERARIARELHDIVAHSVSMMVIQVGAARTQLPSRPGAAEGPLLAAEEVGRQALGDLRRLLDVLRDDEPVLPGPTGDPRPPVPGLPQLEALIGQSRAPGVEIALEVEGRAIPLPAGLELTAYRIVQEALTNALKHSGATHVDVGLRYGSASVRIDVVDNGTATATATAGHGLVGIRERAALFGGSAAVGPDPAGGWRVTATLPIEATHDHTSVALLAP